MPDKPVLYQVEIVSYETGRVEKGFEPTHYRRAQKLDRGVNINLNHEKFYTRIMEFDKVQECADTLRKTEFVNVQHYCPNCGRCLDAKHGRLHCSDLCEVQDSQAAIEGDIDDPLKATIRRLAKEHLEEVHP